MVAAIQFLYPGFLYALSALSIPIIIHLFNFRKYKTVYFSNVAFIKDVKKETKAKSQLKNLLILLFRLLTITALVMAFAQPYIPTNNSMKQNKKEKVSIYIDNSFSMDVEGKNGKLLEVSNSKAIEIADAYQPSTRFLLTTNSFSPKHQHFINKEQLIEYIPEIQSSPSVIPLSTIIERQKDFTQKNGDARTNTYLISDFQKISSNISMLNNDSLTDTYLIPIQAETQGNLYIDTCWFESFNRKYGQQELLNVRIRNNSDEDYSNISAKLFLNDSLKSVGSFNISPSNYTDLKLSYTNSSKGIIAGYIEITDYPITYDNKMFISYQIDDQIDILEIFEKESNKYISSLFKNDPYFKLESVKVDNIDYGKLKNKNAVILSQVSSLSSGLINELLEFVNQGGILLISPEKNLDISSYNQLLNLAGFSNYGPIDSIPVNISKLSYESEIYNSAFEKQTERPKLPLIAMHYSKIESSGSIDIPIIQTEKNQTILSYANKGKGKIFTSSIGFNDNYGTFHKHPLFIPTIINIVLSGSNNNNLYSIITNDEMKIPVSFTSEDKIFHLHSKDNKVDIVADYKAEDNVISVFAERDIKNAGNYYISTKNETKQSISLNYNRLESKMKLLSLDELEENIANRSLENFNILKNPGSNITQQINIHKNGIQIWKWFLIAALVFIALEIFALKILK